MNTIMRYAIRNKERCGGWVCTVCGQKYAAKWDATLCCAYDKRNQEVVKE